MAAQKAGKRKDYQVSDGVATWLEEDRTGGNTLCVLLPSDLRERLEDKAAAEGIDPADLVDGITVAFAEKGSAHLSFA